MKYSLAYSLSLASAAVLLAGCGGDSTKPSEDLIADFTTDNGLNPADGRQGGFYVYGDPNGTFDPPKVGEDPYPIDSATGNPNGSGPGSFHTKATGFSVWGAAMGTDFMPKEGDFKGTYDASKYKGVSFWAKAGATLKGVQVSFPDIYTDAKGNPNALDPTIFPCAFITGATNNCSPYLVKFGDSNKFPKYVDYQIGTEWKRFDIYFEDTQQDQYNPGFHTDADKLEVAHLTSMAIQVNAIYVDSKATANDFELSIDDVNFIR
jgi:hypothetical protein